MIIEGIFVGRAAEQFKAVLAVIPVQGRGEVKLSLSFRPDGREGLQGVLKLVVISGAVECAGTEVLVAHARLPAEVAAAEIVCAVPESLKAA